MAYRTRLINTMKQLNEYYNTKRVQMAQDPEMRYMFKAGDDLKWLFPHFHFREEGSFVVIANSEEWIADMYYDEFGCKQTRENEINNIAKKHGLYMEYNDTCSLAFCDLVDR